MAKKGNAYDQLFIFIIILYHNNSDGINCGPARHHDGWMLIMKLMMITTMMMIYNDDYDHGWSHLAESATSK